MKFTLINTWKNHKLLLVTELIFCSKPIEKSYWLFVKGTRVMQTYRMAYTVLSSFKHSIVWLERTFVWTSFIILFVVLELDSWQHKLFCYKHNSLCEKRFVETWLIGWVNDSKSIFCLIFQMYIYNSADNKLRVSNWSAGYHSQLTDGWSVRV